MRVIAGSAKGHRLQSVPGTSTRPIADRAKEALFSILGDWIEGAEVLDLFGGTGAVGIEALSRGAASAHFVDNNRRAVQTIRANLEHCKLAAYATVELGDSFLFLERYTGDPFDLIFIAPPQYKGLWSKALQAVDARPDLLYEDGIIVVQIDPREDVPVALANLGEFDSRTYGSVRLIFYERLLAEELGREEQETEGPGET